MPKSLKVYSYSGCGTCRKAINWLNTNNINYELIDIIKCPPTRSEIIEAINQKQNLKLLFNTSGKSYRTIGADKVKAMSEKESINALHSDPKLIKRPFAIKSDGIIIIGFKETEWAEALLSSKIN